MQIAFVSTYDASDVNNWSGTSYYMSKALASHNSLDYIDSLKERNLLVSKAKKLFYTLGLKKNYLRDRDLSTVKGYSKQIARALKQSSYDVVFSPSSIPIALLKCQQPIVFWTDATFAGMLEFYSDFSNLCAETLRNGMLIEQAALDRCALAIYSSHWAAETAIKYYQVDANKIKVVLFGANLECDRTIEDIQKLIRAKPKDLCKLLFIGVDWQRKGGDIALEVARSLNSSGVNTELTIVGCQPPSNRPLPSFIKVVGRISKATEEGKQRLDRLLSESHFLILPTQADCSSMVCSEANSFGVPCLMTNVGGMPSIIRSNINGQLFEKDASIVQYCHFISNFFTNYSKYELLAINSFREYQLRLNWNNSAAKVKDFLVNII